MEVPQMSWDLGCLGRNQAMRTDAFQVDPKCLKRAYPVRLLRYWFVYHLLREETERQGRPLRVAEVGIDTGQMRFFLESIAKTPGAEPLATERWTGIDLHLQREFLEGLGYDHLVEANVEQDQSAIDPDTDAVILLHVLEHLYDPKEAMRKIAARLKPGAVLIGGFPSVPHWCAVFREPLIRLMPNENGHVSKFSPHRVRKLARDLGLELDFFSGAFFLRASGLFLEDSEAWIRFNLRFAQRFPGWPGETYWLMRVPR